MSDKELTPDGGAPNETDDSIYGHTNTVFTIPELNDEAPREPLFIRVLSRIELTIGIVLFALIVFGVMYQVVGRYFPAMAWVGAGEIALMSMIALTFVMAGYLVGRKGHIVLEIFDGVLKGTRLFTALRVVSGLIMVATSMMLVYEAWVKIGAEWVRSSPALQMPYGVLYLFAFLGFLSAAIHSVWMIRYANRPERQLDISEMEG
ncbi:MAG: TRAP transporter small permease [Microbacteriaceae bacterium]|nr:TRAP transporter small permease [Microbacteriaceae bacterium]